ncbi:hypothetical protein TWF696_004745 [Orbilia brochopaga]|uniref:F-box domain-containing protein n=1 Tax=Orbilia brochopaga TaxID=3140254 RepID=A0AAV9V1D9_9PEZI
MPTSLLLKLPYELHEKIAKYISNAHDTIAFSNTSRVLRERLHSNNHLWYLVLKNAGSVKNEYDTYYPNRDYLARVQSIRNRKRLRCQICLSAGPVKTVDMDKIFYGVFCETCLSDRFHDMKTFRQTYDNFWDGFVNPPQFEIPRFLLAKTYSKVLPGTIQTNELFDRGPSCGRQMHYILKSDTTKLLRALIQSEEAVEECVAMLKARNVALELAGLQDISTLAQNVLEMMVEDYEDHHQDLHGNQSPDEFREYWRGNVERIIDSSGPPAEARAEWVISWKRHSKTPPGVSKGAELFYHLASPLIVPVQASER